MGIPEPSSGRMAMNGANGESARDGSGGPEGSGSEKSGPEGRGSQGGRAGGRWGPCDEEHHVSGDRVLEKVRELLREGNVRRLIIRNEEGRTIVEIPLTVGVVGTVVAPVWAAIGAIAALVANCSIVVEREPTGA